MVTWICSSGSFGPTTRAPGTSLRLLPGRAARLRDDEFAMMNQRFLYLMTATGHGPEGDFAWPKLKNQQATAPRVEGRLAVWDAASLSGLRQGCNDLFHNSMI